MPGSGLLHIDVMDHDLFTHDLIGRACIDIESRFFNSKWEALSEKPIETIPIYREDFFDPQGYIKLWVDILDKTEKKKINNPVFIQPRPISKMEVRMIIWECEGLPNKDSNGNDIFFDVTIDKEAQNTDIHFNSWDGSGSFNWRIVIPIEYDENQTREQFINLQAYDYDIFTRNDFIAKKTINITKLLKDCDEYDVPMTLDNKYFENNIKKFYQDQIKNIVEDDSEKKKAIIKDIEKLYNFFVFESNDSKKFWINLEPGCLEKDDVINFIMFKKYFF
jgi:hypothetical protein